MPAPTLHALWEERNDGMSNAAQSQRMELLNLPPGSQDGDHPSSVRSCEGRYRGTFRPRRPHDLPPSAESDRLARRMGYSHIALGTHG